MNKKYNIREIKEMDFQRTNNGYEMSEVDEFLNELAEQINEAEQDRLDLSNTIKACEREIEDLNRKIENLKRSIDENESTISAFSNRLSNSHTVKTLVDVETKVNEILTILNKKL
ncbi:DivIVA domain-containing protein [Mesoplasma photuris]|uniref:DivIVA domain-containing protein n=1 Tax=Mesoplasma photuris TaxID=217731 RepID=UPI0004E24158|nr:DivIVA domain-containing protein [Mesoplasma photuris]